MYTRYGLEQPRLYQFGYTVAAQQPISALLRYAAYRWLAPALHDLLDTHLPHLVIATFPLFTHLVAQRRHSKAKPPVCMTVVTDFGTVHPLWFTRSDDVCIVPTEAARNRVLRCGIDPQRLATIGIPVDPRFGVPRTDRATLRGTLGWHEDRLTVLLGGGAGVGQLDALAQALDAARLRIQLAIVMGTNRALADHLRAQRWHMPVHVYNFVPLADLMHAADLVATKTGGLTVSEALAAGKPLLIHGTPPAQEHGNLRYLQAYGAGV